jgi:hypothetical protein
MRALVQRAADLVRADVAERQRICRSSSDAALNCLQRRRDRSACCRRDAAQLLVEQFAAGLHVAGAVELVEPGAHDLDAVAAVQLVVERHDAAVDLGAAAAVAEVGVHVVGEVDGVEPVRQVDDLARGVST